ncbi:MAG: AGE family epimerase/isomerase [Streptosporangiales bacterium]|nr:AGE family epimerase/isomerase [Streptosporangiales bacterium]
MTTPWRNLPAHRAWLAGERDRVLGFAAGALRPGLGYGRLDAAGRPEDGPVETWITGRMTHVFSLAHLLGLPGAGPLADHGVAALADGPLRDAEHDGWYAAAGPVGPAGDDGKSAYQHAFVILGAASAAVAGRPGAAELLDAALGATERRFWREDEGACAESWDRAWREPEPYRGANSNMHLVEAFLAAADATGEERWRERAGRIAARVIHNAAARNGMRPVEHFTEDWRPLLEYNADEPAHAFRPYGTTVGHWLEWGRLLLHLEAASARPASWLVEDAGALFAAAVEVGWAADGADGFVYTLDWSDRPVVRSRMHWVIAEAAGAAAALGVRTGDPEYERWYRTFWDHAAERFVDRTGGSWFHELAPDGTPATGTWAGKPDAYHVVQATLLPWLPLAGSLAGALRDHAGDAG